MGASYKDDHDGKEDSDCKYTGGDLTIYGSALDDVYELLIVKNALKT